MSKTRNNTVYTDELAKPIVLKPISLLNSEKDNQAYIYGEVKRKLKLLHRHYGVNADGTRDSNNLLLCMAIQHVPGFKIEYPSKEPERKVGSPSIWKEKDGIILFTDVYKRTQLGESVNNACIMLVKTNKRYAMHKPDSLRQRYYEVKKRLSKEHQKNIQVISEHAFEGTRENILGAYLPDGRAMLNNPKIASSLASLLLLQKVK